MSAQQLKKIGATLIIYCSAVFEIESSSRVLMPRMDTSQRTGIISPAEGFAGLRYCYSKTIWNYNGTVWINSVE
jgi:hypothetical protein